MYAHWFVLPEYLSKVILLVQLVPLLIDHVVKSVCMRIKVFVIQYLQRGITTRKRSYDYRDDRFDRGQTLYTYSPAIIHYHPCPVSIETGKRPFFLQCCDIIPQEEFQCRYNGLHSPYESRILVTSRWRWKTESENAAIDRQQSKTLTTVFCFEYKYLWKNKIGWCIGSNFTTLDLLYIQIDHLWKAGMNTKQIGNLQTTLTNTKSWGLNNWVHKLDYFAWKNPN